MLQEDMASTATSSPASSLYSPLPHGYGSGSWVQELTSDQQSLRLIKLLYDCAAQVAAGAFENANFYLEQITQLASLDAPHVLHRLAAVFADALARKLLNQQVPGLSRALMSTANSAEAHLIPAARQHMFHMLPFVKLAYLTTNRAIFETVEKERSVHVVDLSGPTADPVQWIMLFRSFYSRGGGAPQLRITAVHDNKEFLTNMAGTLTKEAEACGIRFQFNAVEARLDDLDADALHHILNVRPDEALAISVVAQLHRLLAVDDANGRRLGGSSCLTPIQIIARSSPRSFGELLERELNTRLQLSPDSSSVLSSLSPQSPAAQPSRSAKLARFLSAVKALSPKIVVVTEPEANHNATTFHERFHEAVHYYALLFDCLERASAVQRHHHGAVAERARVERLVLGEEIRGVVALEGAERKERHERLAQWVRRMEGAGMERVGLSYNVTMEARKALQTCGWGEYEVTQDTRGQGLFFCFHRKPLYSISAWRPATCRLSL